MFELVLNENGRSFQVTDKEGSNVAEGVFRTDPTDLSCLISIHSIDESQINQIVPFTAGYLGKTAKLNVFLRLPSAFDETNFNINSTVKNIMAAKREKLKIFDADSIPFDTNQYDLVLDKEKLKPHSNEIYDLMKAHAFWAANWKENEGEKRINAATLLTALIDRSTNTVCGFGRLFVLVDEQNRSIVYMSDICVSPKHQGKRLGSVIVNSLLLSYKQSRLGADDDTKDDFFCLIVADRGSGQISAGKIYEKHGFQRLVNMEKAPAFFMFGFGLEAAESSQNSAT